jgi:hypothetical protein
MRSVLLFITALLLTSCITKNRPVAAVAPWPEAEVFVLPKEAGFQSETLELKDARFRYWFSSDSIGGPRINYPIEGSYWWNGEQLHLSSGKVYTARQLNGVRTLWQPSAIDHWNQFQIINVYGILLLVEGKSRNATLKPLFTQEEWDRSATNVARVQSNTREPHKWEWKQDADVK